MPAPRTSASIAALATKLGSVHGAGRLALASLRTIERTLARRSASSALPDLPDHDRLLTGWHLKHGVPAALRCRHEAARVVQIAGHGTG